MKNIIIASIGLLLSYSLHAQSFVLDNYESLMDNDESTVIHVSQAMFQYAAAFADGEWEEEDINVKELLEGVISLDVVISEDNEDASGLFRQGMRQIDGKYDELVTVRSKDGNFGIYIDDDNGTIREIVGIAADGEEFVAGSLLCNLRMEDITAVIAQIDNEDFTPFKKMKDLDIDDMNVYPNPASTSSEFTLELPSGLVGGQVEVINSNGSVSKSFIANDEESTIDLSGLTPGYYVISVKNEAMTVKKKVMVVE